MKKTLSLTIPRDAFERVACRYQRAVYLPLTNYWRKRLQNQEGTYHSFATVTLRAGLKKLAPTLIATGITIETGRGNVKWGAPEEPVFKIKLGSVSEVISPEPVAPEVPEEQETQNQQEPEKYMISKEELEMNFQFSLLTNSIVYNTLMIYRLIDEMFRRFITEPVYSSDARFRKLTQSLLTSSANHRNGVERIYRKEGVTYFNRGFDLFYPHVAQDMLKLYFPIKNHIDRYKAQCSDLLTLALRIDTMIQLLDSRIDKAIEFGQRNAPGRFSASNFGKTRMKIPYKALNELIRYMDSLYVAPDVNININTDDIIHTGVNIIEKRLADCDILIGIVQVMEEQDKEAKQLKSKKSA